jgi:hypothetical protein
MELSERTGCLSTQLAPEIGWVRDEQQSIEELGERPARHAGASLSGTSLRSRATSVSRARRAASACTVRAPKFVIP